MYSMSQFQKAIERLRTIPKDYTYTELKGLLIKLGYVEYTKGSTSGSRVKFFRDSDGSTIILHKPHPTDILKEYAIKEVITKLSEAGDI